MESNKLIAYNKVLSVAESCQSMNHVFVCCRLIENFSRQYNISWDDETINLDGIRDLAYQSYKSYTNHVLSCIETELRDPKSTTITINKVDDGKVEIFVNGAYTGRHKL